MFLKRNAKFAIVDALTLLDVLVLHALCLAVLADQCLPDARYLFYVSSEARHRCFYLHGGGVDGR